MAVNFSLKPEQLPQEIEKVADLVAQKANGGLGAIRASRGEILDVFGLEQSEAAREMFETLDMVKDGNHEESEDQDSEELVDLRVFLASLYLANMDGQSAFKVRGFELH